MTAEVRNLAASVRERLLAGAKARGEDFNVVLRRYGVECVLRRLGASRHADSFVLKGAMLFLVWTGHISRPTRDLDLLGFGPSDPAALAVVFTELCTIPAEDGVDFSRANVTAASIIDAGTYRGVRVKFEGRLEQARIPVQVDIGFGDDVVPAPEIVEFPTLLGLAAPRIRAYPREAMVAEKLHAIVALGEGNSRMKDFHDIVKLSETHVFDGSRLARAVAATFQRRETPVIATSTSAPPFFADITRSASWRAFHVKLDAPIVPADFGDVGERVRRFLEPVMEAVQNGREFGLHWAPGGPWR